MSDSPKVCCFHECSNSGDHLLTVCTEHTNELVSPPDVATHRCGLASCGKRDVKAAMLCEAHFKEFEVFLHQRKPMLEALEYQRIAVTMTSIGDALIALSDTLPNNVWSIDQCVEVQRFLRHTVDVLHHAVSGRSAVFTRAAVSYLREIRDNLPGYQTTGWSDSMCEQLQHLSELVLSIGTNAELGQ